ncbi:MAG: resolvase, partial [Clostridia bacterium]|nr:resolvase [Clostridia bacterium]
WRTNANGEKFFGYQCYGTTQTGTIKSRLKRGLPIDGICQSPMIAEWKLQMMANYIFRHFLTNKQKVLEIANSLLEEHIGDTEVQVQDNSKLIEQKQRELDRANTKRRNLIDLLSNCDITREDYQEARADVDRQIDMLKAEIEELTPVVDPTEEEEIDYESKITVLRYALEQYTNFDTDGDIPESVIEAFVEKIEVSKDCFRWHLRGDFGGDSPIPMNVEGNRKKGATISPQYIIIPPANFGDSGCYQRI